MSALVMGQAGRDSPTDRSSPPSGDELVRGTALLLPSLGEQRQRCARLLRHAREVCAANLVMRYATTESSASGVEVQLVHRGPLRVEVGAHCALEVDVHVLHQHCRVTLVMPVGADDDVAQISQRVELLLPCLSACQLAITKKSVASFGFSQNLMGL
eukprot:4437462-Pleurochrysis_carterae.AAC.3